MASRSTSTSHTQSTARNSSTLKQRSGESMRALRESLHLPEEMNDPTVLGTALAEVVAEDYRLTPNPHFALAVRQRYSELLESRVKARRTGRQPQDLLPLVPKERPDHGYSTKIHVDPFAPPDPATIIDVYGRDQLARALQDYMLDSLKQTAAAIERANPGTKPSNRSKKQAVIDYIVTYWSE